jgi:hypothetical protein
MTNQDIHSVRDIGAKSFGEARAPMSRPAEATREPVIQIRAYRRAALKKPARPMMMFLCPSASWQFDLWRDLRCQE